jgi:hypothetical protein
MAILYGRRYTLYVIGRPDHRPEYVDLIPIDIYILLDRKALEELPDPSVKFWLRQDLRVVRLIYK